MTNLERHVNSILAHRMSYEQGSGVVDQTVKRYLLPTNSSCSFYRGFKIVHIDEEKVHVCSWLLGLNLIHGRLTSLLISDTHVHFGTLSGEPTDGSIPAVELFSE